MAERLEESLLNIRFDKDDILVFPDKVMAFNESLVAKILQAVLDHAKKEGWYKKLSPPAFRPIQLGDL